MKKYVKEYMDKAVKKKETRDLHKATHSGATAKPTASPATPLLDDDMPDDDDDASASPTSATDLKRKRAVDDPIHSPKKSRTLTDDVPPPPPPPPPAHDMPTDVDAGLTPTDDVELEVESVEQGDAALGRNGGTLEMARANGFGDQSLRTRGEGC